MRGHAGPAVFLLSLYLLRHGDNAPFYISGHCDRKLFLVLPRAADGPPGVLLRALHGGDFMLLYARRGQRRAWNIPCAVVWPCICILCGLSFKKRSSEHTVSPIGALVVFVYRCGSAGRLGYNRLIEFWPDGCRMGHGSFIFRPARLCRHRCVPDGGKIYRGSERFPAVYI